MDEINFKNKTVLVVGAHPDDNDFGAGATVAKAVKEGARVIYLLATTGQRGSSDECISNEELSIVRKKEQIKAANFLGVDSVHFLGYSDGEVVANIELKEKIVEFIRRFKPDIVFTMDPSHFYYKDWGFVNHSDHRAVGEATLDAVYPLARDLLSFPEHRSFGLKPHKVKDLFLHAMLPSDANYFFNVTDTLGTKFKALQYHKSQIGEPKKMRERMQKRAAEVGKICGYKFAEGFIRLKLPG